jgi:flagellar biosynthesis component FlhA
VAGVTKAQFRDLLLPAAVVSVVGMMVFPLPIAVLDILLVCNLALAISLLISAIYLSEPEKFTSLPTILLLATIFRLGLNISTTRQILGTGEAPEVVVAFGQFVIGGNIIVGVVVFVIVSLVQFLVIAKGAERVAEVAARFTLDAMPGKQMSIDADIRSGLLSLSEAREKRRELHRESKLFGSLDGAMKFVKGDAIVGLLITVINITAGFILGVYQQGLTLLESLQIYTIFTVGDGLASQIPALLISVAAGIAVTRVETDTGSFAGREMLSQLGKEPQALATTAVVLGILATVPGLPVLPLLLMSLAFYICYRKIKSKNQQQQQQADEQGGFRPKVGSAIVLKISLSGLQKLQKDKSLPNRIQSLRGAVFDKHGVLVPDFSFEIDKQDKQCSAYLLFKGVQVSALIEETESVFSKLIEGTAIGNSKNSATQLTIDQTGSHFATALFSKIRTFVDLYLEDFINDTSTRQLLDLHTAYSEDLINNTVPTLITVTELTSIFKFLIRDKVGIKELPSILQAIADNATKETRENISSSEQASNLYKHEKLLIEIREALARNISKSVCDDNWNLKAVCFGSETDGLLANFVETDAIISPLLVQQLQTQILDLKQKSLSKDLTVIASRYATVILKRIFGAGLSGVTFISANEVCKEVKLEIIAEINCEALQIEEAPLYEEKIEDNNRARNLGLQLIAEAA